jgi:hypothetical protein
MRYQPVGGPINDFSDYLNSNLNEHEIKLLFIFYIYSTSSSLKKERNNSSHNNLFSNESEQNTDNGRSKRNHPQSQHDSLQLIMDLIIEFAPELITKAIVVKLIIESFDLLKPILLH